MFKGLKSLLAGLLAGTALGILFSPKKGGEIRKKFKKEIDEGGIGFETVKETLSEMGKELGGACKKIGCSCKECCDKVAESEEFKKGAKKAKIYVKNAKKKTKEIINRKSTPAQRKKAKVALDKVKKSARQAVNRVAKKVANKTR